MSDTKPGPEIEALLSRYLSIQQQEQTLKEEKAAFFSIPPKTVFDHFSLADPRKCHLRLRYWQSYMEFFADGQLLTKKAFGEMPGFGVRGRLLRLQLGDPRLRLLNARGEHRRTVPEISHS